MPAHESIDRLPSQKHLIDLSTHSEGDIGLTDDFELNFIFDDILLVEYVDENDEGEIQRNGIFVPTNAVTKAWRKARVILTGPKAEYVKVGDVVINLSDKMCSPDLIVMGEYIVCLLYTSDAADE